MRFNKSYIGERFGSQITERVTYLTETNMLKLKQFKEAEKECRYIKKTKAVQNSKAPIIQKFYQTQTQSLTIQRVV